MVLYAWKGGKKKGRNEKMMDWPNIGWQQIGTKYPKGAQTR